MHKGISSQLGESDRDALTVSEEITIVSVHDPAAAEEVRRTHMFHPRASGIAAEYVGSHGASVFTREKEMATSKYFSPCAD